MQSREPATRGTNLSGATATQADLEQLVRRLADESEIRSVIARFARASDHMDMDLLRSCYHEGATDAHGSYNGDVEGFVAWSTGYNTKVESKFHHLGQSLIEIEGDEAWAETYCVCHIRLREDDGTRIDKAGIIRYVDLFERRNGEWRIVHRKLVHHPGEVSPVEAEAVLAPRAFLARLDRDDPSYDRRPESFLPK